MEVLPFYFLFLFLFPFCYGMPPSEEFSLREVYLLAKPSWSSLSDGYDADVCKWPDVSCTQDADPRVFSLWVIFGVVFLVQFTLDQNLFEIEKKKSWGYCSPCYCGRRGWSYYGKDIISAWFLDNINQLVCKTHFLVFFTKTTCSYEFLESLKICVVQFLRSWGNWLPSQHCAAPSILSDFSFDFTLSFTSNILCYNQRYQLVLFGFFSNICSELNWLDAIVRSVFFSRFRHNYPVFF